MSQEICLSPDTLRPSISLPLLFPSISVPLSLHDRWAYPINFRYYCLLFRTEFLAKSRL